MKIKLLLTILGSIFFINCVTDKDDVANPLALIPNTASVIIKVNDLDTFKTELKGNEIVEKLQNSNGISLLAGRLKPLELVKSKGTSYIALLNHPENNLDFVFIPSDTLPQIVLDSSVNKTVEKIVKGGLELKKLQIDGSIFYTSVIQNKEIIGSSESVIEMVWNTLDSSTSIKEQFLKFDEIENLTKSAQIWLDLNDGKDLMNKILGNERSTDEFNYADWLSLDISVQEDGLILNGIGITRDSLQNYLGLFSKTKPIPNIISSIVPGGLDSFVSFTFSDYKNFSANQKQILNEMATRDSIFSAVEEIGISQMGAGKLVLLKTYGTANISDYINNIQSNSLEYQGSEIKELTMDSLLLRSFYPLVEDFTPKFATVMENTFVFSETKDILENFISSNKSGQTFDKTLLFENIKDLITEESTVLSVSNSNGFVANLNQTGLEVLSDVLVKANLSDYLFGSQVVADNGFLHTNYFIKKITKTINKTGALEMFRTQLDADIYLNPQFFSNHRTNRKDIIVQDQDNVLYLITNKGKIIWKKELESPIQGKIHEVDIYRNGKYQLAFTTNNRFYIIDRNGKEVAPFTFKYEGGNLNPLAVFDYSNNKNYRFVVTQGDRVFMYNNDGKIVSGFKYTKAEDNILGAPQHFVIGTNDYIVFRLTDGTLKILNRVGNVRVSVPEKISFSDNEVKVYQNKFIVTSKHGILYEIDTKGKIEKSDLQLTADHGFDATSRTLVIMNDNVLSIRGKKVTLDLGVYAKPTIFYLNDKIYVSVTDIQNLKTYLFDSQAEPIEGFPVYGASTIDMADMDNDNKPELVIKDQENSLLVYKVN